MSLSMFFFQAEDGIRDLVRSRGLGDVYKRQGVIAAAVQGQYQMGFLPVLAERVIGRRGMVRMVMLSLIHI